MGSGLSTSFQDIIGDYLSLHDVSPGPELGFLTGLGQFISEDKGSAPVFLLKADYSRTVNIAVAGNTGVGKSLLVNTVRGVKPGDSTWAPVGVTETTREPVWYEFPGDGSVRLWDMEGAGSSCAWDNYTGNVGLRYFDVVLLLCSTRLTDSDMTIMRELEKQSIPFFFVRTKLDEDVRNNEKDCGMTPEETEESIRCDLQLQGITSPYLINARVPEKHDFPKLVRDIVIRLEIFERKSAFEEEKAAVEAASSPGRPKAAVEPAAAVPPEPAVGSSPEEPAAPAEVAAPAAPREAQPPADPKEAAPRAKKAPAVTDAGKPLEPHGLIWSLPEGKYIAPIEALYEDGGHWLFLQDDHMKEYFEAEVGSMATFVLQKINGTPEHTYALKPDGRWEFKMKNGLTAMGASFRGKDYVSSDIIPNSEESKTQLRVVNNKRFIGKQVEYIEGGRLVSENWGMAEDFRTAAKAPFLYRTHRFVVDSQYWMVMENVYQGRFGIRRFKRYPFYRIANETDKVVTMKTYSVAALFNTPNMTTTIEPWTTRVVDCFRGDVGVEQVVFTLPNRAYYTISQAEPFETYSVRMELFS